MIQFQAVSNKLLYISSTNSSVDMKYKNTNINKSSLSMYYQNSSSSKR